MRPLHSHPNFTSIYREKCEHQFPKNGFGFEAPKVRDFICLKPELNLKISLKTETYKCGSRTTPISMEYILSIPLWKGF